MTLPKTNPRLYPSRFHSRYYSLSLLREALRAITAHYLREGCGLVLVDFGCGIKPYQPIFQKYVSNYIGIDLPSNPQADCYSSPNGNTGLQDACADIVLSTQVLEHVLNPTGYLEECYRLLKRGGLLILSTHGHWMYHPDPTDYWRYTSEGLRHIVQQAGFQILELAGLMGLAATGVQLLQDGLLPRVPKALRAVFVFGMQRLAMLVDKLCSNLERAHDACIFVVVAKKSEQ